MSKVPPEQPSFSFFHLSHNLKIKWKVVGRITHSAWYEMCLLGFDLPWLSGALCSACWVPARALSIAENLKTIAFCRFTLIRFNNFHPNCPVLPHSLLSFIFCPWGKDLPLDFPSGCGDPSWPEWEEKRRRGGEKGVWSDWMFGDEIQKHCAFSEECPFSRCG